MNGGFEFFDSHKPIKYGLVRGFIDGVPVNLTQYMFGTASGSDREFTMWVHPRREEQSATVLPFIKKLVNKAVDGDLSVIPSIHWWYVHLAPTRRGPGGIAEMITNTLCRLHGENLPDWKDGVSPSIEVLLQPDPEKFRENYHLLFSKDQEHLKNIFKRR